MNARVHVQRAVHADAFRPPTETLRSRALFRRDDLYAPEVWELTLAPRSFVPAAARGGGAYEHLTVVRGLLVVQVAEELARLGPGDSCCFAADRPHSYRNPSSTEAVAHLVRMPTGAAPAGPPAPREADPPSTRRAHRSGPEAGRPSGETS